MARVGGALVFGFFALTSMCVVSSFEALVKQNITVGEWYYVNVVVLIVFVLMLFVSLECMPK